MHHLTSTSATALSKAAATWLPGAGRSGGTRATGISPHDSGRVNGRRSNDAASESVRTTNLTPSARVFTSAESRDLARYERASRRPASRAERLKLKWFLIGAAFALATVVLLEMWVRAGGM